MSERVPRLSRRNFLLSIGAGSAATAAAIVAKTGANAPATTAAADSRARRGYRVSEHVSNYYRTTKV
ncbi:MAG: formate dehydrogenase [Burkholderiales bacterium]